MKDKREISIWEAVDLVKRYGKCVPGRSLPVMETLGCVLAEDVVTKISQPPFPRSSMDGYAIRAKDSLGAGPDHPVKLPVVGCQYAGDAYFRELQEGEALRIMTGAAIPAGADCVIRQEDTDCGDEEVSIYATVKVGQNYCEIGEDFPLGDCLAQAGDEVDAYLIAAAVAGGIDRFMVRRPLRAAVITTGDELQMPGSLLEEGKIYNSNLALFATRLRQLGCQVMKMVSAGDDLAVIMREIKESAETCDVIITTGGVSVGIKDLLPEAVEQLGAELVFHGIAIKPGMPTMFSVVDGVPVISLSGNPYSAAAVFEILLQPLLREMKGQKRETLRKVTGISKDTFPKFTGCTRFLRGYYEEGRLSFAKGQRNGQTKAGIGSNCLICLQAGREPVMVGDELEAYLI